MVDVPAKANGCSPRLGGWAPRTDGYVVNNHGGSFSSPRPGVVGPLPNGRISWLINGGDPNIS